MNPQRLWRSIGLFLAAIAFTSETALAQTGAASLTGLVSDSSGG